MDIRKLQRAIVDGLEDVKAQHIAVFNTEHLSSMFERVIIASGTSNRQTKALAASVRDSVKKGGMQVMSTEGEDNGEWIIVDCGAAIAHIMQPAIREYYHLEEIWGGKAVRMKVGEVNQKLVKASEPAGIGRRSAAKAGYQAALAGPAGAAKPGSGNKTRSRTSDAKTGVRTGAKAEGRAAAEAKATAKTANRSAAFKRVASKTPVRPAPGAKAASAKKTTSAKGSTQQPVSKQPTSKQTVAKRPAAESSATKTAARPAAKRSAAPAAKKPAARKTPTRS
jgi:ribosome-associated protein